MGQSKPKCHLPLWSCVHCKMEKVRGWAVWVDSFLLVRCFRFRIGSDKFLIWSVKLKSIRSIESVRNRNGSSESFPIPTVYCLCITVDSFIVLESRCFGWLCRIISWNSTEKLIFHRYYLRLNKEMDFLILF